MKPPPPKVWLIRRLSDGIILASCGKLKYVRQWRTKENEVLEYRLVKTGTRKGRTV